MFDPEPVRNKHGIPALGFAILKDGKTEVRVSGFRRNDNPAPVEAEDAFHFGSCSKAATALLARLMAEEGLFTLDDAALRLMTHRAGLPALLPDLPRLHELDKTMSPRDIRALVARELLAPGTAEFSYSNLGYILLGVALERAADRSFEELMREKIFDPLGMTSAGFGAPPAVHGHLRDEGGRLVPIHGDNPSVFSPSGRIHANLGDWLKLLRRFLDRKDGWEEEGPYLSSALQRHGAELFHDGSNTLNYARQILLPARGAALVVVANDGGEAAIRAVNEVTVSCLREITPASAPAPAGR